MIHINLLSREQLDSLDLREPHAIVTRRRRVLSYVPCVVVWTLTLWILVCVGLWFFAMVKSAEAGETCRPLVTEGLMPLAEQPEHYCLLWEGTLEELGSGEGYTIAVLHVAGHPGKRYCQDGQMVVIATDKWQRLCTDDRRVEADHAAYKREQVKKEAAIARLLAKIKGERPL